MDTLLSQEYLRAQYRDSSNLSARAGLHIRFSTQEYPWFHWVFDHFDIPENGRVLELGCGTGLLWRDNLERIPRGWSVTVTDASQGMVREAEENLPHTGLNFTFAKVDAQSIPYEEDSFDAVVANHMLYHVPDLATALSEIRRVLRPGGRLYAATIGLNHMAEIREVPGKLEISTPIRGDQIVARFNLESGAGELSHWFAGVEVDRRNGVLVVTEADPLVDYVMSFERLPDEEAARLHAHFSGEIQRDGAFQVTTESGIFKAVRES